MAEVLTQSQIDALLSAAKKGDMGIEESSQQQRKYRRYNFYQPQKFTKDRIRVLQAVYDDYAKLLANRINALLHTSCKVEVNSIEEQRYYEFSNALADRDVLSLVHLIYNEQKDDLPVLVYLNQPIILSMIDRMMGGSGDSDEDLPIDYSLTELEIKLYEKVICEFVSIMGSSWKNYLDVDYCFTRVETNPTLMQIISMDEAVIIVDFQIKTTNAEGRMSICLPGMMLSKMFAEINNNLSEHKSIDEDYSEKIFNSIRDSELELVGELCSTMLTLRDIYHLNVGDVIDLNHGKDEPVNINIENHRWFDGKMGIHKRNKAIKIGNTYNMPPEGDIEQNGT